jgi:hypothetical protein
MTYKDNYEEVNEIVYDSIGEYGVSTISVSEFNDSFKTEEERSNALKSLIKEYEIKLKDFTGVKTFVDDSFTEEYIIDKEFGLTYEFHFKE